MKWVIEQNIITRGVGLALLLLASVSICNYWSLTTAVSCTTIQNTQPVVAIVNSANLALLGWIFYVLFAGKPKSESSDSGGLKLLEPLVIKIEELTDHLRLARVPIHKLSLRPTISDEQQEFKTIVENAPDIIARFDKSLTYVYVNSAVEKATGISAKVFLGKTNRDLGMPEVLACQWESALSKVFTTREQQELEFGFRTPQEPRYYQCRLLPEFAKDGSVEFVLGISRDITQLKRREEELKNSEERLQLQAIFEGALDAIAIADNQGKIVEANPVACQLFGLEHSQLVGSQIAQFMEAGFDFEQGWSKFLQAGEQTGQLRLLRPDGTVRTIEYAARANFVSGRHLSVMRDITEPQQAEAALRQSEARFHLMADSAPVLMWMSDAQGYFTFFNLPWLNFTGRSLDQEIDQGWLANLHPEDVDNFQNTYSLAYQQQKLFRIEYRLRRADGFYCWVLCTGAPQFTTEGKLAGYIGSCIDITDRKQAEEEQRRSEARYRAIVEDQTELICRFCPDGKMTFVNDAYCRFFGKQRQEIIGQSFFPLIHNQEAREHIEQHLKALSQENPVGMTEELVTTAKGENCWLQWSNRAIFDQQGELVELQAVGRDISKRKQAESALQQSQRLIEQITDTTPNHLYIYDLSQDCEIYTNRQLQEFLGCTPEQLQSMGSRFLAEFVHPEDLQEFDKSHRQFTEAVDSEVIESEYRLRNAQGEWHWFHSWEVVFTRTPEGLPQQILGTSIGIDDRKQAESALQASEERLRVALEVAGMISWDWNILTDQVTWATHSDLFLGMPTSSYNGHFDNFVKILHPADRERVLKSVESSLNQGKEHDIQFRVVSPNGEMRWAASRGQVFYNETGRPVRMLGVDRDITEQKLAEEALQKSEELYRTMARNFPNGAVLLFDKNMHYTLAEGTGLADFGLSKELIEGKTIWEVFPAEICKVKEQADLSALSGIASVFEIPYGGRVYLVHVLPVKNERGEIFAGMAMWQNISDRKRAELALLEERNFVSAILDTANALIVVLDRQGKIHRFNRTCERISGYCFPEVKGKYLWDLFSIPEEIETVKKAISGLKRGQFPNEYVNYWAMRDGSRRLISWSNTALLDIDGSVKNMISIGIDITERQKAEEVRLELEKEQELSALRLRFFSMASHEFRTPLSTILMSAQLLESCSYNWSEEKRTRNLRRIEFATKHLIQLLEDILTINRAETGKLEFNPDLLEIEAFCQHLVEEMQLGAEYEQNIIFESQCSSKHYYLDSRLVRYILTNLLSNAIKYSPEGGDIDFRLICTHQEVIFQIQDQGVGIPVSDQSHLFEAFHRGGNIEHINGSGLGLTVVKKCVELHEGSIDLDSEVGIGTTFTVKIPITSSED
ncbi:MAG: PAS domain S-box protein [Symploca sp. SIO3C6]|nr:PAS domain S-box protein [Symploca sp. SIO3C6]